MAGWSTLRELVELELVEAAQEGRRVGDLEARFAAADTESESEFMDIYRAAIARPVEPDFPFTEPNGLEEIRALRPEGPRSLPPTRGSDGLSDKMHGAWLGRSIGCALGLPLEHGPFPAGSEGRPGWKNIELWFKGADAWPIRGYVPRESRAEAEYGLCPNRQRKTTREDIAGMIPDDDIRYTVLGTMLLERFGDGFDPWDVGKFWHEHLPYGLVCTAETQAYLNFAQVTWHLNAPKPADWPAKIEWVRTWLNPYREWIGAQIRVDGLAYAAAGQPELAARLAWQDAAFSHVKNGIYGAMFMAVAIAAAFVESDPERIVAIGLSEIPANCRLAADIRTALEIARSAAGQLDLVERIELAFGHYHWIHTNGNAALVAAALVFAKGDFETAITTAVLGGWDTDCNGASIGSIAGAMAGARAIPDSWSTPLRDTIFAELPGWHPASIAACARRSLALQARLADRR
jgi:hypothetical protein